jgi:hypothetical protein
VPIDETQLEGKHHRVMAPASIDSLPLKDPLPTTREERTKAKAKATAKAEAKAKAKTGK